MLNIALPKGRLGDKVYGLFSSIGYDCAAIYEDNRKLAIRYIREKADGRMLILTTHQEEDVELIGGRVVRL